ncbi:MAG TPA: heavy metal-associated domain-containing protein [Stellaceae bacterium]|nr:heavy metal-associated domain-containing protein [Stellaceae bacterium]
MDANRSHDTPASGTVLAVTGMTCSGCAATLQRVLSRVPGVSRVDVDLAGGRAMVGGTAAPAALIAAVEAAGYGARLS